MNESIKRNKPLVPEQFILDNINNPSINWVEVVHRAVANHMNSTVETVADVCDNSQRNKKNRTLGIRKNAFSDPSIRKEKLLKKAGVDEETFDKIVRYKGPYKKPRGQRK